jgi:beta-lactamase regulating signal transducer with metallopeptidase domain
MTGWFIEALIGSALLMIAVLALRRSVARRFGPRAAYALWALPALRLLLPPLPGWAGLFAPRVTGSPEQDMSLGVAFHGGPGEAFVEVTPAAPPLDPVAVAADPGFSFVLVEPAALLAVIWLSGAVVFFGWQMLRYHRFVGRALDGATLLTTVSGTTVWLSPAVGGPMAAGVYRRRIFLPLDFKARYSPTEQRLALLHEGAHHDRGDLVANFAGLAVVALHWWNPVAHFAWKAFRADQELACDATVLQGSDGDTRQAYGLAVLKSACERAPTAACAMNQKSQLKDRITMMKTAGFGTARLRAGWAIAAALIGGGLLLTASGDPPQPPAPPAPPAAPAVVAPPAPPSPPAPPAPPAAPAKATRDGGAAAADAEDRATRAAADAEDMASRAAADAEDRATRAAADAEDKATRAAAAAETVAAEAAAAADAADAADAAGPTMFISLTNMRADMASACARQGKPVAATADWEELALCGSKQFKAGIAKSVHASLAATKASIKADRYLDASHRRQMVAEIDAAMRSVDRELKAN